MGFIMLLKVVRDGEWKCILYTHVYKRAYPIHSSVVSMVHPSN
jgi:uncharacterized protein YbaR (Trm112 family)